jgi:hypothetical protein
MPACGDAPELNEMANQNELSGSQHHPFSQFWYPDCAILLGGALATATTSALAEMRVHRSPEAVRIEARDASVAEIRSALSSAFNMHYQAHLDKRLSGIYAGPLSRVLARILDGYEFVLKTATSKR